MPTTTGLFPCEAEEELRNIQGSKGRQILQLTTVRTTPTTHFLRPVASRQSHTCPVDLKIKKNRHAPDLLPMEVNKMNTGEALALMSPWVTKCLALRPEDACEWFPPSPRHISLLGSGSHPWKALQCPCVILSFCKKASFWIT